MAEKENWQVQVAFYLSIGSVLFGAFQWWHGERESRIKITMEIAERYIQDRDVYRQLSVWEKWIASKEPWSRAGQRVDDPELIDRWSHIYYLNYVAYLANEGKIDIFYLPPELRCSLALTAQQMRTLRSNNRINLDLKDLDTVGLRLRDACRRE